MVTKTVSQNELCDIGYDYMAFALANYHNSTVYITGGSHKDDRGSYHDISKTLAFELRSCSFREGPCLIQARYGHSSLVHGTNLYIFGGYDSHQNLYSMEVLSLLNSLLSESKWELTELK